MTIGIGIHCHDGIVLCSDTQMTAPQIYMKYEHPKIYQIARMGTAHDWTVAMTFAGDPVLMDALIDRMTPYLQTREPMPTVKDVQICLEEAMPELHKNLIQGDVGLDVLCGVTAKGEISELFYASRTAVIRAGHIRYVGIGDSSLIRYLEAISWHLGIGTKEAIVVATYMVHQAKQYIEGVGGDTYGVILYPDGIAKFYDSGTTLDIEQRCDVLENAVRSLLKVFLDRERKSDEDFSAELRKFCETFKTFRNNIDL